MNVFSIWDDNHAEHHGDFDTLEQALQELRQRAMIRWDQPPNRAPCRSWRTCGRDYHIQEDAESAPRRAVLHISAAGVKWSSDFLDQADNLPA